MSSRATLSAAADDRKARLAKLRSIKRKLPDDEVVAPESDRASPAVVAMSEAQAADEEGGQEAAAGQQQADDEPDVARLHLSGRNYDPEARGAKLGFETQPNLAAGDSTLEAKAAKLEAEVRRQQEDDAGAGEDGGDGFGGAAAAAASSSSSSSKPIDLFKLQPKKPNWDLKRELNKRLEPLNARTDMAIARLLRERLQAGGAQPQPQQKAPAAAQAGDPEEGLLEGAALVEGIRLREQEDEEDERRERELEEAEN